MDGQDRDGGTDSEGEMNRARRLEVVVVSLVLLGGIAAPMAAVASAQTGTGAYVTVGNVSVSPATPEPGETVTITAELRNSGSSTGAVEITEASLRGRSLAERSWADNLGSLGPGDSIDVPFSTTFDEAGERKVTVVVRGRSPSGGVFVVERPIYVTVEDSTEVSMAFSTVFDTKPAVGAETPINLTVANGHAEAITGVQLDLGGSATVKEPNQIRGSIDAGGEETFEYDVTFDEVGTQTLSVEVTYTTAEGVTRTTTRTVDIEVVEPTVKADLSARTDTDGETRVELTNFGNTEFRDVEITARANDRVVARNLMSDLAPDSNASVSFDIGSSVDGVVTYTATYTAAGERRSTSLRDQSSVSGEIHLVSIETSRSDGSVTLQGDAANVGSTTAESVLLSVVESEDVGPTAPVGEYYVGEVEGSEFGTFELSAATRTNASSIPVEITYIVDGDRVTTVQEVDVAATSTGDAGAGAPSGGQADGPPGGQGPLGGLPLTEIGVVLALSVVGALVVAGYRWRNQ